MADELYKICSEFRQGLLGGKSSKWMRFAVSAPLQAILCMYGYNSQLIYGEIETPDCTIDHVWLELPDGQIIDATADQFNEELNKEMPDIYIGEIPNWYYPTVPE